MRKSFFTSASFTGMAGATTATILICNTVQSVSGWFNRGVALGIAVLVTFGITFLIQQRPQDTKLGSLIFMTLLNGCLVYFSAFGVQNSVIAEAPPLMMAKHIETVTEAEPPRYTIIETPQGPKRIPIPAVYETTERIIVEPADPERTFRSKW